MVHTVGANGMKESIKQGKEMINSKLQMSLTEGDESVQCPVFGATLFCGTEFLPSHSNSSIRYTRTNRESFKKERDR